MNGYSLGVTGSRYGMTANQRLQLARLLTTAGKIRHGDCKGADEEAHELALVERSHRQVCGKPPLAIIVHPPTDDRWRAFCEHADEYREPLPYLLRNKTIVVNSDKLAAAPASLTPPTDPRGQGTWATVRHARRIGRPYVILEP